MSIQTYTDTIRRKLETGLAGELAYRSALEALLEELGGDEIHVVNEPSMQGGNSPDCYIERKIGKGSIIAGFVEAKDLNKDLSVIEETDQLIRYLEAYNNLLLTNHLEFRWYIEGELREQVSLGSLDSGTLRIDSNEFDRVRSLLVRYVQAEVPQVYSAEDLAQRMATMARELGRLIEFSLENPKVSSDLPNKKKAVEEILLPNLTNRQFADMFAQTIAYGLFAARARYDGAPEQFNLEKAFFQLPKTNPFLRQLFQDIATELDTRVRYQAEGIAQLLAYAEMEDILDKFGDRTRQKQDPVIYFYETFLNAYDPEQRVQRGVYYTPEPVVSYIVRSVDALLQDKFNRIDGLADTNTMILDPATGTGTFLYFVINQIYLSMQDQLGTWQNYVRKHLLPRVFGFELLMAPYTVAHMKLNILLGDLGYEFDTNASERLSVFLTDTLEKTAKKSEYLFAQYIADEANAATHLKRGSAPIEVILGNPPYSNYGQQNEGDWITSLVDRWKPVGEKKWPRDDYMKFMRFGQWRIDQNNTDKGIMAFVTNHNFVQSVTLRAMRESLMKTFDEIYIIDLHGNVNTGEVAPDGSSDANVFDIKAGVCIFFMVKLSNNPNQLATVYHADLWGTREHKYTWLSHNDVRSTRWNTLKNVDMESCLGKLYFFANKGFANIDEYCLGWSLQDIFPLSGSGVKTERDRVAIKWTNEEAKQTVLHFRRKSESFLREEYDLKKDSRDWKVPYAIEDVQREDFERYFTRILYRPFDIRHTWYSGQTRGFIGTPGYKVNSQMLQDNLALISSRTVYGTDNWRDIQVTENITEFGIMASRPGNTAPLFPLYQYLSQNEIQEIQSSPEDDNRTTQPALGDIKEQAEAAMLFPPSQHGRRPNLNLDFIKDITAKLSRRFSYDGIDSGIGNGDEIITPEDIFYYAYAIFHSPAYRSRYNEFLKTDFPRLPLTSDPILFDDLAEKGKTLAKFHLLKHPDLRDTPVTFPIGGSTKVGTRDYDVDKQRIYIDKYNRKQYFENVPKDAWEFHMGGYQVLDKWLKNRLHRTLSHDDVRTYRYIVKSIIETMRLMEEIDDIIPRFPIQ